MSKKQAQMKDVIIIGAGASGMMAAITAARRGRSVLLLEQMDKVGKKLLATGNGKCNFTNEYMNAECYHGNAKLLSNVMAQFNQQQTLSFFREIGIWPKDKNGYYYPNSEQALSVVEALQSELHRYPITTVTGCKVSGLYPDHYGFVAETTQGRYRGQNVIVACGLLATPKLGSDGSMIPLIKELGHRFVTIVPALCGFSSSGMDFKRVAGVRAEAELTLVIDGKTTDSQHGELQLTEYGLSGIPVFQLSSTAALALYAKKEVMIQIDFLPNITTETLHEEIDRRVVRVSSCDMEQSQILCGLLHQKLIPQILKKAQISHRTIRSDLTGGQKEALVQAIKHYPVALNKVRGYEYAQVCAGGIRTEEIDTTTLESKYIPGLYFAGEFLDVDGICGGYNLQWAWSSGYVAGSHV